VAVLPDAGRRRNLDDVIVWMAARETGTLIKFDEATAAEGGERHEMKPARDQPRGGWQRRQNRYLASGERSPIACHIRRTRIIWVRIIRNAPIEKRKRIFC
jgi:hypothetical protein